MDGLSETDSTVLSQSTRFDVNVQDGLEQTQPPCARSQPLDSHFRHGHVSQECLLEDSCVSTELSAKVDDEIPSIYSCLSHCQKGQDATSKMDHDSIINSIPVEILSIIFVFVKDSIFNFEFKLQWNLNTPYRQPSHSPPLLLGAVCRRWRDITLATPQLWTDIIINPLKHADGQLRMVEKWAHRSGVISLDITICLDYHQKVPDEFRDVRMALRSLEARWHNIVLWRVLTPFFYQLFDNLQSTPPIDTLFLELVGPDTHTVQPRPPISPRQLIYYHSQDFPTLHMKWDRLVFIEIQSIDAGQIVHIIRNAPNLRHCDARGKQDLLFRPFPYPDSPVANQSLVYLKTNLGIIPFLTLPSLLHLDYLIWKNLERQFNGIIEFMDRSCSPLEDFNFQCHLNRRPAHIPPFDRLWWITSLSLEFNDDWAPPEHISTIDDVFLAITRPSPNPILPRLKKIHVKASQLSASSWSMFSSLMFLKNIGSKPTNIDAISNTSILLTVRLSQASVQLTGVFENTMDKDTFLRLLEAKKSGVDLTIVGSERNNLFNHIAKLHDIVL